MASQGNTVVARAISDALAFGIKSNDASLNRFVGVVSAMPASGSGTAVFFSGDGNRALAVQCVQYLNASGQGGYGFWTLQVAHVALSAPVLDNKPLVYIAAAMMGAEANPANGAIVFRTTGTVTDFD